MDSQTFSLARLRTALAPLLVAWALLFGVAPTLDTLLCGVDGPPVAAAQVSQDGHGGQAEDGEAGHAVCAHGHCHHGSPMSAYQAAETTSQSSDGADLLRMAQRAPPASYFASIERPPRA